MTAASAQPAPVPAELVEAIERVRPRLGPIASALRYFTSIGSTNDEAAALSADGGGEGTVVIAEAQMSGRGRQGRTWFSPPGAGLYVSVVLMPGRARANAERATSLLTLMAGAALAAAVERSTGLGPDIKWPNDLLVGRRKLAGILAEGVTGAAGGVQSVVLGYGINVGPASYPPELADRATSLETELGRAVDRAALCAETLASLAEGYHALLDAQYDAILARWRERAPARHGARVAWDTLSGPRRGVTVDIDEQGALVVRTASGLERLNAGEVRWES